MNAQLDFQVPIGFELAHAEWLAIGGSKFQEECWESGNYAYYRTRYWALVRQAVGARDSATCFRCQGSAGHVHHLTYDFIGIDHLHPEALISVCAPCHQLVEYARVAESLVSRIHRRISLCRGFLEGRGNCREQNAAHVYARLLEYQDELVGLQTLFATGTPYKNPRMRRGAKANAGISHDAVELDVYEERAASLVSAWQGSEGEKAERLIPMLELEIQKCERFAAAVLEPVSPPSPPLQRTYPAEALTESGRQASGVEALVVGIKFHRGNADGIAAGEGVQLVREPTNAYDPNAIRVNLLTGETLGYLTSEVAAVFAKQLDAGGDVSGQISKIVKNKVYVAVYPR